MTYSEIDFDLIYELLRFRSYSKSKTEDEFCEYLVSYIRNNITNVNIERDAFGNIYVTKGDSDIYPCIIAHTDINQSIVNDYEIINTGKCIFGFDNTTMTQCGLGFDDKAGIYLCLHMLYNYDNIKVVFFKQEEIGGVGSNNANLDFFKDCSFILQGDRNSHNNDISEYTNGVKVVSDEFMLASQSILDIYEYNFQRCIFTDCGVLAKNNVGICSFNISIGYIQEHSEIEVLIIDKFINAIGLAEELVTSLGYIKVWKNNVVSEYIFPNTYIDDWYDQSPRINYSTGYKFTKEDDWYIQDCLDIGICPVCDSHNLDFDEKDNSEFCKDCGSIFNQPKKTLEWNDL